MQESSHCDCFLSSGFCKISQLIQIVIHTVQATEHIVTLRTRTKQDKIKSLPSCIQGNTISIVGNSLTNFCLIIIRNTFYTINISKDWLTGFESTPMKS